jgi:hypothetical protein
MLSSPKPIRAMLEAITPKNIEKNASKKLYPTVKYSRFKAFL